MLLLCAVVLLCICISTSTSSSPTTGEVTSPNYPSNYPDDSLESNTITVASGSRIELTFCRAPGQVEGPFPWSNSSHLVSQSIISL